MLRQDRALLSSLKLSDAELIKSTVAAKLNGYVRGFGTLENFLAVSWFLCRLCPGHLMAQLVVYLVRRSGLGVVSWTCDPVLALGQRFDSHSRLSFCCNHLG